MQDMKQMVELMQRLKTARAGMGAISDLAVRAALDETISLVARMMQDQSWTVDAQSRERAVEALTRTMTRLQAISKRVEANRQTPSDSRQEGA